MKGDDAGEAMRGRWALGSGCCMMGIEGWPKRGDIWLKETGRLTEDRDGGYDV